jgi:hypothetical protein
LVKNDFLELVHNRFLKDIKNRGIGLIVLNLEVFGDGLNSDFQLWPELFTDKTEARQEILQVASEHDCLQIFEMRQVPVRKDYLGTPVDFSEAVLDYDLSPAVKLLQEWCIEELEFRSPFSKHGLFG